MKPDTRRIPTGKPLEKAAKPCERCYGGFRILLTGSSEAERANASGAAGLKSSTRSGLPSYIHFFETEKTQ
jgi:hypothetical protein